ncbi:MAG: zinc ribbon domain-containing protein [Acidobacteria bacterium]|nr:zinc ribbon domain-containing protein [Acidobacteriota bacterium]MBI3424656.1 zinc ribbon domain-containing protein [Acidobacteriota bacterium]
MFCPSCGAEERQRGQFCRACGTDLRTVRTVLEKPDAITASAVSARQEIGRALADRIRAVDSADELSVVAEDVLPEIEKFLESPEEKRLRRMRAGLLTAAIGLGAALAFSVVALSIDHGLFVVAALGVTTFFLGLGLMFNGRYLTLPPQTITDHTTDRLAQKAAEQLPEITPRDLNPASAEAFAQTITEHTTHELANNKR